MSNHTLTVRGFRRSPTTILLDLLEELPNEDARCVDGLVRIFQPKNIDAITAHARRQHLTLTIGD